MNCSQCKEILTDRCFIHGRDYCEVCDGMCDKCIDDEVDLKVELDTNPYYNQTKL